MGRFSIKSLHSLLELQTHTKSTARPTSTFYPSKMGQKRKCLSLDTKVAIIRQVKEGKKPKHAIAAEHEIRASSLSTILKNSDKSTLVASRGFSVRAPWWQTEQLPAYNECPNNEFFSSPQFLRYKRTPL